MKIPHTINPNFFKEYKPSKAALSLVRETHRKIRSEDTTWDESHPLKLTELCLMAIMANFQNRIILNELPCWDKNYLLEILPVDLPLSIAIEHIPDEIYWKRRVKDRWKDNQYFSSEYDSDWKRMYLERHVQEAVEAMTPEGYDLDYVHELCSLVKDHVKVLNLRQLQILKLSVVAEEEDEFSITPEPCDHINLGPIITELENLTELHVRFGLDNVGSDYKKSLFEFSLQDCRNLGEGVAKSQNLRLLRVHNSNLDDERMVALLSSMEPNESLKKLDFSYCLVGDIGVTALAKFLKTQRKIKSINLSNNNIQENGVYALAFVLTQGMSPVEVLNLKFNAIEDTGLKHLASAMVREKVVLQNLNVSCCGLGEESGIFLAEVLNRNANLKVLDLSNNVLGSRGGRALKSAMDTNKSMQFLNLRLTEIPEDLLNEINENLYINRMRSLKGDAVVMKELKMKRMEDLRRQKLEMDAMLLTAEEREKGQRYPAAVYFVNESLMPKSFI